MSKNVKKYCSRCRKSTIQFRKSNNTTGERILIGLFTFGFNELLVETYYECSECGKHNY